MDGIVGWGVGVSVCGVWEVRALLVSCCVLSLACFSVCWLVVKHKAYTIPCEGNPGL
jgi:hypothetical protein